MSDIRTPPPSKEYRDNFDAIFRPKAEFCKHCGAGLGEHFREGEGTCEKCDPDGTRGFNGYVNTK